MSILGEREGSGPDAATRTTWPTDVVPRRSGASDAFAPSQPGPNDTLEEGPLVERAITRALTGRYAQAAAEVDRIIDATYRVIEREGTVDPTTRDILQEAGLVTQAFYRHFESKDELLLVILDDGRRAAGPVPGAPHGEGI